MAAGGVRAVLQGRRWAYAQSAQVKSYLATQVFSRCEDLCLCHMLTLLMSNTQVDTVEDVQDGRAGPDRHPAPDRGAPLAAVQPRRGALLQVKISQLLHKKYLTPTTSAGGSTSTSPGRWWPS